MIALGVVCSCAIVLRDLILDKDKDPSFSAKQDRAEDERV
jgi:hypothetical protein